MSYDPPIRDLLFALRAQSGFDRVQALDPGVDEAMAEAVLSAAGDLTSGILAPLNRSGDIEGARLENGRVVTPQGFQAAWRAFAEGGWCGLSIPAERGGQGLPKAIEAAVYEMVHAANLSFGLCPTLSAGASEALELHGSEAQKTYFIPRLASGELTGAMALTEPQAGSDLAAVATRAEPDGEAYRLFGQKIFITWGDHDLTDSMVHLVLARLPDAPPGVKGISLFLAPRRLIGPEGRPGEANAIRVIGLEHKLGIHASPTCALAFEGARAELIGQPHQGLAYMFTMMNAARLHVGLQGVGIAERAWQKARAYAAERRQGRSAWTGEASAPIIDHPDVRLTLALTQARLEAARGVCLHVAAMADIARLSPDPAEREEAEARAALLTPIAKAWSTEIGMQAASDSLQVHGGMGFIEETGAAQYYRDARIPPIYEGTNGIQAIDLIGRKLARDKGEAFNALVDEILHTPIAADMALFGQRLAQAVDATQAGAEWLIEQAGTPDALAGASDFLLLLAETVGGWMHARAAAAAGRELSEAGADRPYLEGRIKRARLYGERILARTPLRAAAVMQGAGELV